jgi:hypothetical protein
MKKLLIILIVTSFFTSCSIQKRHYSNGYTVNWNHESSAPEKEKVNIEETAGAEVTTEDKNSGGLDLMASVQQETVPVLPEKSMLFSRTAIKDSCDVIELKDNQRILAKVREITPGVIKYYKCGETSELIISKSLVSSITYSNGLKETIAFEKENAPSPSIQVKSEPEEHISAKMSWIFGICAFVPVVGWIFAIMAIVHGIIATVSIKNHPDKYKGAVQAIVGIALGVAGLLAGLLVVYLIFGGFPFI